MLTSTNEWEIEMEPKQQRDNALEFCNANLRECCVEILEWNKTGLLKDGKVRELCEMLNFDGHSAMPLAEEFVKTAAMERLVELSK